MVSQKRPTLALAIAACSSSGTQSGSGNAASSKTLVIESTSVTAPSQNFNPYVQSATGYSAQATGLIYEPLYIFNVMNPTSQPVPMLASGQPTWSNGGKTLTVPIRSGVKWSDGKPFTASDVAFTYNLVKKNPTLYTASAPLVTSATATSPTSVTLNFSSAQFANLFLIGQVYIVPQHVWGSVSNPVTYTDANPVGSGPYMLQTYSSHGFLLKQNPSYWNKSAVKVSAVDFPFYSSNANLVPPIASGQIDWAGSNLGPGISSNYLSKSNDNTTWPTPPCGGPSATASTGSSCPPRASPAMRPRRRRPAACFCRSTTPSSSRRCRAICRPPATRPRWPAS